MLPLPSLCVVADEEVVRGAPDEVHGTPLEKCVEIEVDGASLRKPRDLAHLLTMLGTTFAEIGWELYQTTIRVLRRYSRLAYCRAE